MEWTKAARLAVAVAAALVGSAYGQVPRTLSYQGLLTDGLGNPKPDGTYILTFRLYDSESDGAALWVESKSVRVERGLLSTVLGDQTPFASAVKFDRQYYLGVQLVGQPELVPRVPLSAVGYSLRAVEADTAQYARQAPAPTHVDSARIAATVADGSVTSGQIRDGTILLSDIAQNGATDGEVIKWNGSSWSAEPDRSASGGEGGGWTRAGRIVGLSSPSDTVAVNTSMRLGKLNINGDVGLNLLSSLYFGGTGTRISGLTGGDLRLVAEDLSALTTEDITFGHFGDETWVKIDNANKRVGIGTLSVADRLHVTSSDTSECFVRVEGTHPRTWGQAGVRFKTPQNTWDLRMDQYRNYRMPEGALSLRSKGVGREVMTWMENGNVGIGTPAPTKKLQVRGNAAVEDTLFAGVLALSGDLQAIRSAHVRDTLHVGTLDASRVLNGPGVAYSRSARSRTMQSFWTAIDTVVLEAPGAGYAFLSFSGTFDSDHEVGRITWAHVAVATEKDGTGLLAQADWRVIKQLPGGWYLAPTSLQAVVAVPAAGSRSFYVVGMREGTGTDTDTVKLTSGSFSVLYFPARHGAVDPPLE